MDHSNTNNNECLKPHNTSKYKISFVSDWKYTTDSKYIEDVKHLMHYNVTNINHLSQFGFIENIF